ncbi:TPA: hypothetical protein ACH3X1_010380 [Trebouxia sp. C0004]
MSQNAARQEAEASRRDTFMAEAARTQAPVGAHTNLVHLAESCPDAAYKHNYEEYNWRQGSAPENVNILLRASQQTKSAGRQSSQEASYLDTKLSSMC